MKLLATVLGVAAFLPALTLEARAGDPQKLYSFYGDSDSDALGESVGSAGDVNADGYSDVIAGGWRYARVYSGKDGKTLHTFKGDGPLDGFGESVSGAGDVNRDGYDDLIVGSDPISGNYARVFSGKDGKTLYTFTGAIGAALGRSVDGAGDVNNDGYDDVIVGAYGDDTKAKDAGAAHVYSGKDGKVLHTFYGDSQYDTLGFSVSGAGDVNLDGHDDVIVGSYADDTNGTGSGAARVFSGKDGTVLHTFLGDSAKDNFGHSVGGEVDVNGDGYPDFVVGAPKDDDVGTDSGLARVFSGKDGKALYTFKGDKAGHWFGFSVSGAGDVNDDGHDDIFVGAGGGSYGRVFSGEDGKEMFTLRGNKFGWSVSGTGDVNGDGKSEVLIGSSRDDTGGTNAGAAFVYGSPIPEGTVTIDAGAVATSSTAVTLSLDWEDGDDTVDEMRLRNAGGSWGNWVAVSETKSWTLESGDGTRTVEVQYRDTEGVTSIPDGDSIVLDQTAPTGSLVIESGADWTGSTAVTVELFSSDAGSGVSDVRLRHTGGPWSGWSVVSATTSWSLVSGDGLKTVECEFRDLAGNVSETAADTIGLDETAPTGSATIEDGAEFAGVALVTVRVSASDGSGSGVAEMRFRRRTTHPFEDWVPFSTSRSWTLSAGDGEKSVEVQLRDFVGNESEILADTIVLDLTGPTVDSISINDQRPYVLPGEDLEIEVHARDNLGGSGVAAFTVSHDNGATWSEWNDMTNGNRAPMNRTDEEGLLTAQVIVRDHVGNESKPSAPVSIYVVGADLPWLGSGAKFAGGMAQALDVDCVELDLVKGDVLSVKVKAKSAVKRTALDLAVDLCRPDGTRVLLGRYPTDAKKPGIVGWAVTETGRYLLLLRVESESAAGSGTYRLTAKVKQAKANKKGKGEWTATEIPFEAVRGSTLKASLKGEGLDLQGVTLVGPAGPVAFEAKGKPGSVKLGPVVLDQGTGTYRLVFATPLTVVARWSVKLPKIKGTVAE